jgi:hypothetical protein
LRQHQHGHKPAIASAAFDSSTARSGACIGTTMDARSRLSLESHSVAIQSLIALQNAAAM